jgi:hypothetical protein
MPAARFCGLRKLMFGSFLCQSLKFVIDMSLGAARIVILRVGFQSQINLLWLVTVLCKKMRLGAVMSWTQNKR